MFCKNCGKELADNAFACPNCGCLAAPLKEQKVENNTKKTNTSFFVSLFSILAVVFANLMTFISWFIPLDYYGLNTLFSFLALGCAITAFVFGILEKKSQSLKLISTLIFIACLANFIGAARMYSLVQG